MVRAQQVDGLARNGPVRVLASGDLVPENDFDLLIRAFAGVARLDPRARLIIVGEGCERALLEQIVAQEGVAEYVALPGALPEDQRAALLARAHVFALTRHQGCAQAPPPDLGVAMTEGLSVVVSDVGTIGDLVADGLNGLVVPPGEPSALSRALHLVVEHDALRRRLGLSAQISLQDAQRRISA